jgi:hypothetical protein
MKANDWDDRLFAEQRDYIRKEGAREAFDFLVAAGIRSNSFNLRHTGRAQEVKSFTYNDVACRERPFAFIVNRGHILFYVRKAGIQKIPGGFSKLKHRFATVTENNAGEWTVRIETREEAVRMHAFLFTPANADVPQDDENILGDEILDDIAEEALRRRSDIGPADKEQLIRARRGQGRFRRDLENLESGCRLTGLIDRRHLRASHIKPWRDSDSREKLDPNNGLLFSPHIAHLFHRGHISFTDVGDLLVSKSLNLAVLAAWALKLPIRVRAFRVEQCVYLDHHRREVFEKSHRRRKA